MNLRRMQMMTFVEIANTYVLGDLTRNGKLTSTKADKTMRGLGIKGMKVIIEKYGGTLEWEPGEDAFTLKMSFFTKGEKEMQINITTARRARTIRAMRIVSWW